MEKYKVEDFGKLSDGQSVSLYTLENDLGDQVKVSTYGACLVAFIVNDKDDRRNIVLSYDDASLYEEDTSSNLGGLIGPFANRISNGEFRLNEHFYKLKKNDGNNALHSSELALNRRIWDVIDAKDHLVTFRITQDADNYPGKIEFRVTYEFNNQRQLKISYRAKSTEDTYLNLTNHAYFNLNSSGKVNDEFLEVNADYYTPVDENLIPTGEVLSVKDTDFDFREEKLLDTVFNSEIEGLDNNFVLNKEEENEFTYAARIIDKDRGKQLVCYTTMPAVQVYTANAYVDVFGEDRTHEAVCLETQFFPDSVNIMHFPSCKVKADEVYSHETIFSYVDLKEWNK